MDIYSKKYAITNDCMDINYRLKPLSAIMYFQDGVARFLTTKNLAAFDIIKNDLIWIISEFNVEFINELPFWSEEIEVSVWLSEISKLKLYFDFEIKHNGLVFAQGDSCWYVLDSNTKRPSKTEFVADRMVVNPRLVFGEHKKFKVGEKGEKIKENSHIINFNDIDFNNHVNNKIYINLAETAGTKDFRQNNFLKKLSVKFNKESFFGDKLVCSTYKTDDEGVYIQQITNGDISSCDIVTCWEKTVNKSDVLSYNLSVRSEK